MKKYSPEVAWKNDSPWRIWGEGDSSPIMIEMQSGKYVKSEEAERKIKELREIAERAIYWLDMAALIDADKDNVELYQRKSAQMKEDLEKLK